MSEDDAAEKRLVPGRECGACTHCCVDLAIVSDGMRKLPGVVCENCTGGGCAIYDRRPRVCRDYHCLWRELPNLDESWRPDLCGVLIQWGEVPAGFAAEHAVDLILVGPPETLQSDRFAGLAGGFIDSGTATFLKVLNGPEFLPFEGFLNHALGPAVAARDYGGIRRAIELAYAEMMTLPRVPATIEDFSPLQA